MEALPTSSATSTQPHSLQHRSHSTIVCPSPPHLHYNFLYPSDPLLFCRRPNVMVYISDIPQNNWVSVFTTSEVAFLTCFGLVNFLFVSSAAVCVAEDVQEVAMETPRNNLVAHSRTWQHRQVSCNFHTASRTHRRSRSTIVSQPPSLVILF